MQNIIKNAKQKIFLMCAFAVLALCLTTTLVVRADQSLANITTGTRPTAVGVNPVTNRTYIANRDSNTVTVINGADVSTTTINVGTAPVAVAVNVETNRIYVVNQNSNNVTVINGADNSTSNVNLTQTGGFAPVSVAVNPVTNLIYVGNGSSGGLTVINGANNSTLTISVRLSQYAIAVNPATNKIYAVSLEGVINVIDAANGNQVRTLPGITTSPENFPSLAVNPATNRIYVVSGNNGGNSGVVVVNAATNKIYLTDVANNVVRVVNGADNSEISTTFATGAQPCSLADLIEQHWQSPVPETENFSPVSVVPQRSSAEDFSTSSESLLKINEQKWN